MLLLLSHFWNILYGNTDGLTKTCPSLASPNRLRVFKFFIVINVYMALQIARIHVLLNNLLGHVDFKVA